MSEKRVEITNVLCRKVQLLIKGGATNKEAGYLVGVSAATVSRIRTANYDPFKYQQNTEARRKLEVQEESQVADAMDYIRPEALAKVRPAYVEDKEVPGLYHLQLTDTEKKDNDQVPGQMAMDLPKTLPPSDLQPEAVEKLQELMKETILTAQVKAIMEKLDDNELKTNRAIYASADRIGAKLDKLNDNLCQILRRMDKC